MSREDWHTPLDPLNSDNKPTIRTMKTFLLFLLTIAVVTSAPNVLSASGECKIQHLLLEEIIEHVNDIRKKEVKKGSQILVENVLTPHHCTHENFCKAGVALSAYKAEKLGLNEKDWLLPRHLVAYSGNTHCNVKSSADRVEFLKLLENIKLCAQKEYKKPCGKKEHSNP